jgi:hypothetical protein
MVAVGDDAERAGGVPEAQLRAGDGEVQEENAQERARDCAGAISQRAIRIQRQPQIRLCLRQNAKVQRHEAHEINGFALCSS